MIKYRFKGKVNSSFIIRGMFFSAGSDIDLGLSDRELDFVKTRCEAVEIIDLHKKTTTEIPETVLEDKTKEVENELRPKSNGNANKGKHKAKV